MNTPILHVYAQPFWHAEAYIASNRDGLLALRDAVDAALAKGRGTAEVFAGDGEGYELEILAVSDEDAWNLARPYTEAHAREKRNSQGHLWPWQILSANYSSAAGSPSNTSS